MRLLLHACCAPCANRPIESLRQEGMAVTGFWFNPNIHPYTEYQARKSTLEKYAKEIGMKLIIGGTYDLRPWIEHVAGNIDGRCAYCYQVRMEETARYAAENGYEGFTTSLLVSPYQKHDAIRAIAQAAGTDRRSVSAFSMGEHGDSSMVPFSAVTVGGVPFDKLGLDKTAILTQTRQAGMDIIEGKGSTEFGIGLSLARLAAAILGDQHRVLPVSVLLEGEYGQQGVHCGVPCRIGRRGIEEIVVLDLTEEEQQQLDASCQVIRKHIALADSL